MATWDPQVGDIVRIGNGKVKWTIQFISPRRTRFFITKTGFYGSGRGNYRSAERHRISKWED